jgi:hypothetical protein
MSIVSRLFDSAIEPIRNRYTKKAIASLVRVAIASGSAGILMLSLRYTWLAPAAQWIADSLASGEGALVSTLTLGVSALWGVWEKRDNKDLDADSK